MNPQLQQLRRDIDELQRRSARVIARLGPPAAPLRDQERFRYKSMQGDYLVCHTWDGTTEGSTSIYVAKPPDLRQSRWDGVTNSAGWLYTYSDGETRVASKSGETDVDQEIGPAYEEDDDIFAIRPHGGTGVTAGGAAVVWQEVACNRRWITVCDPP